jgi:hypothetical protein
MCFERLLMADPEDRSPNDQDDDEKDSPGIDAAIVFGNLRVIAHEIASCLFY